MNDRDNITSGTPDGTLNGTAPRSLSHTVLGSLLDRLGLTGLLWRALMVLIFAVYVYHLVVFLANPYSVFGLIKSFYWFNTVCLPPMLAAAGGAGWLGGSLALRGGRRGSWRRTSSLLLGAGICCAAAGVYATHIEPNRLQVRRVTIETPKLTAPLRLLHVSDVQAARIGNYERRAFAMMSSFKPDLVIVTGDLLQPLPPATYASEAPKITTLLRDLQPPLGKFFVMGDVDLPIAEQLTAGMGGMRLLHSQDAVLDTPGGRIRIFGLNCADSHNDHGVKLVVNHWLKATATPTNDAPSGPAPTGSTPANFSILAGHAPDFILSVGNLPIDLCLAGHTHGGQVRLPWIGPIMTLSNVPRDWALGYRTVGRTRLNVSGGVGCEHIAGLPALRLNCPPEMTLFELRPRS